MPIQIINDLVTVENNQVLVASDICQKMLELNRYKKQCEELEKAIKSQLLSAMEQCGIKTVDNQFFKATLTTPKPRKTVDTKALETLYPEIYESLLKESEVTPSLRMTYKEQIDL